jgi:hypothetical protein
MPFDAPTRIGLPPSSLLAYLIGVRSERLE